MLTKNHYKTIVISDVHHGTADYKAKELVRFLKKKIAIHSFLMLILLMAGVYRRTERGRKNTLVFFVVLKMMQTIKTEVYYLRGNHDDFLDNIIPFSLGNIHLQKDIVYENNGKKFYVVQGDIFDSITSKLKWSTSRRYWIYFFTLDK